MFARRDYFGCDCLPGRIIHHGAESQQEGEDQERPRADQVQQCQHSECSGRNHHPALGKQQKPPPVDHVGQRTGGKHHQENWNRSSGLH